MAKGDQVVPDEFARAAQAELEATMRAASKAAGRVVELEKELRAARVAERKALAAYRAAMGS